MKGLIQQDQELTEEILKNFIAEKENAFQEVRKIALVTLKEKENCLRQQDAESEEANVLSKAAVILEGIPMDQLMAQALLDKKSLVHNAYNNSESTAEQRAVFQFASNPDVKPSILIFRGQHPDWKKAKKHLLPKMEQNNNETPSDGTNGIELDEGNAAKSKKKSKKKWQIKNEGMEETNDIVENGKAQKSKTKSKEKSEKNLQKMNEGMKAMDNVIENGEAQEDIIKSKKKSKKQLKRKNEGTEAIDTGVENNEAQENIITKSKKKSKKQLKRKNEGTDVMDDGVGNGKASPKKKAKKSSSTSSLSMTEELDDSKKGKKVKSSKKKLNAIEKMMSIVAVNPPDAVVASPVEATKYKTGEELESEQENARPQWQHGKFHRKNNTSSSQIQFNKEDKSNGFNNGKKRKGNGFNNGKKRKGNGFTNGNQGESNGLDSGNQGESNGFDNGKQGESNGFNNGKKRKGNGFTNGNRGDSNGFDNGNQGESNGFDNGKQSERDGFANGRQSYGFGNRRQSYGSTDRMSDHKAQRNKPMSLRNIRRSVPGDSANLVDVSCLTSRVAEPKTDGEQKSSLLRPIWLTNPEDYVPEPMSFVQTKKSTRHWSKSKKSRGNFKRGNSKRGNKRSR